MFDCGLDGQVEFKGSDGGPAEEPLDSLGSVA